MALIILISENSVNDRTRGGSVATADLLLHPVRLRIVQTLLGHRALTTGELAGELADVPTATLYRQVATLAEAGVLEVVGERRARGAVERTYRLVVEAASVTGRDAAGMTVDEHRRAFATFVAGLLGDFDRYLDRSAGAPDAVRDRVGYRQAAVWLTDEELDGLIAELRAAVTARMDRGPAAGRRRRLISTVLLPGDPEGPRRT
jgi:DNA-binding transcriptional ArsR family regulator